MSNLRQIHQACVQYTVEYKGVYPGIHLQPNEHDHRSPDRFRRSGYITWFSSCDKYMTSAAERDHPAGLQHGLHRRRHRRAKFSQAFKCPAVQSDVFKQQFTITTTAW